jgi:DNA helicase-2/ATP-dependent DNA helicase PcrA
MKRLYDDAADRADDVRELALEIGRRSDVATFLQEVALLTNVDHAYDKDPEGRADAVRLSTVHQAKGLEWPVVFVLWAVEGMFPSARSIGESEGDAEERRLFYVAVTRARDELHIGVPAWRQTRDGGAYTCEPSRFVRELPRGSVQSVYGPRT